MMRLLRSLGIALACVLLVATIHNLETATKPDRPVPYNAPLPHTIHGHGTMTVPPTRPAKHHPPLGVP